MLEAEDTTCSYPDVEESCLSCVSCDDNCPVLVAVPNKIAKRITMLAEELKNRKETKDEANKKSLC